MSKAALFIHHKAKPGQRDSVLEIWEHYVKSRAKANPDHLAYYFCFDDHDHNAISVFQLFTDEEAVKQFMEGEWCPEYLEKISTGVAAPPEIKPASLIWQKEEAIHEDN